MNTAIEEKVASPPALNTDMACVALKPHCAISEQEVVQFCRDRLSPYKIPRRVEFVETELPKSASGKILKRILRERFWGGRNGPLLDETEGAIDTVSPTSAISTRHPLVGRSHTRSTGFAVWKSLPWLCHH